MDHRQLVSGWSCEMCRCLYLFRSNICWLTPGFGSFLSREATHWPLSFFGDAPYIREEQETSRSKRGCFVPGIREFLIHPWFRLFLTTAWSIVAFRRFSVTHHALASSPCSPFAFPNLPTTTIRPSPLSPETRPPATTTRHNIVECFNGALQACALAEDVDGAMSLMAEMGRSGVTPDARSFRPLVAACERNKKLDLKRDLVEAMSKLGLEP